jgi:hypothetical protein
MARIVTVSHTPNVPSDRTLIRYLHAQKKKHPDWDVEIDSLKDSLEVTGISTRLSLVIRTKNRKKVIAVIPEDEPLHIWLYDSTLASVFVDMLGNYDPENEKTVFLIHKTGLL